jgi:hypothetical protein
MSAVNNYAHRRDLISSIREQYSQIEGLSFSNILSSYELEQFASKADVDTRDRIFTPLVTLAAFIQQTMSPDQSCRQALANIIADRTAKGLPEISSSTGPYCKARQRLDEIMIRNLSSTVGKNLENEANQSWKWKGRSVKLTDGTTISGPDTEENQAEYPQPESQEQGLGFPIARCVAVISLAVGTVLDFAIGPYQGKETGEHALLREILDCYSANDIFLGDRYYCSYFLIAMLKKKNVDAAFQIHSAREYDFRRGISLGKMDHLVVWDKPARPSWMSIEMYADMPDNLTVRETKIHDVVIVSTFLKANKVSRKEIGKLYGYRWSVEVDLFYIKEIMGMGILRCKTPEMMRKEIYIHILSYNLIRTIIAQAAKLNDQKPNKISFKGALQLINSFRPVIKNAKKKSLKGILKNMLRAIASINIGDRPGRNEPRVVKRRPKAYPRMTEPRRKTA